jgi:drug/metabolite transporter (DMT)-like permease
MTSATVITPHRDNIMRGVGFAALAFFLLAVMNMLAKILSADHHVIEIAFYRNLVSVIPFLAYILITRQHHLFTTKTPRALAARATIGTLSLITTFAAFQALPMSEATVLLFTTSLISPALAFFILKERVGPYRWGAIITGFVGVAVMVGVSGFTGPLYGIGLALCAACMHACLGLLLRIMKSESPVTVTFYFVLVGMLIAGAFMPFIATMPTTHNIMLFIITGLAGGLAQLCLSLAFKNAPPAAVAPLNYTGLIWASGFDIIIWQTIPGWPVFAGAAIICAANLFILNRERLKAQKNAP